MKTTSFYFLVILSIFSKVSNGQKNLDHLMSVGYKGWKYHFSDYGDRNIEIVFISNDTIQITNHSTVTHRFTWLNFKAIYYIENKNFYEIYIRKKVSADKKLSTTGYLKPYGRKRPNLNANILDFIFPDIEHDTITFSNDFSKLQIKEFCFEKVEK